MEFFDFTFDTNELARLIGWFDTIKDLVPPRIIDPKNWDLFYRLQKKLLGYEDD